MPGAGVSTPSSGSESVNVGLGPLANSVAGLELWLQAQALSEPWNQISNCIPMTWKAKEAVRPKEQLTIGIILDDGVVKPTPPVTVSLYPYRTMKPMMRLMRVYPEMTSADYLGASVANRHRVT
jgi:hypothetical protein